MLSHCGCRVPGYSVGYMGDYIGWIGAEAEAIPVTFVDQTGAKRLQARVSPDMTVKKLLPTVISAMRLPIIAPDGTPMSYALDHKEGGIRLIETDTLADSRVRPGDHLIVYPEIVAGLRGTMGGLGVYTRTEIVELLNQARGLLDAGQGRRAIQKAEEALAVAHDSGNYGLVRRAENMILAIEERVRGSGEPWYIMGIGYEDGISGLGLHTAGEQEGARILAQERYELALESMNDGEHDGFLYNLGYLNAIKDIAYHEGATALAQDVSGMLRELRHAGNSLVR